MEETPEVYHYSLAEAAELLGCKESHLLQFAAFDDLPLSVFIADTCPSKDGNYEERFSNYFRLTGTSVRELIANGSTKLDLIRLMEATPVHPLLGINFADHILGRVLLENGSWTYDRFPQTKEITFDANRVVLLAKDLTEFQEKNASKRTSTSTPPASEKSPDAARQPVSTEGGSEQKPLDNWKMRIQVEAAARWRRYKKNSAQPNKNNLKRELAVWCIENNVKTSTGINPDAAYIARHVLRKWEPPNN